MASKSLTELSRYPKIPKLIVQSLDHSLYSASVLIDSVEFNVLKDNGTLLTARSILEIQKQCRKLNTESQVLRHESAYDEMIGGPEKLSSNRLEVSLGDNKLY